MKVTTLLFLRRNGEVLLAMKKRRFGAGKWNGAGGKVDPGETVPQAMIRECQEEIEVTPIDAKLTGRLTFLDESDPDFGHDCNVYVASKWKGEPRETEEMRPQWFTENDIPYDDMWSDDPIWIPFMLQGKPFAGSVTLTSLDGNKVLRHNIKEVKSLQEPS